MPLFFVRDEWAGAPPVYALHAYFYTDLVGFPPLFEGAGKVNY
jgi:hypothetical protein